MDSEEDRATLGVHGTSLALLPVVIPTDKIAGVLLGTALGDALGLPHEGLGPEWIARRLRRAPLDHQMLGRRGLISDDTEHAAMVARALVESAGEVQAFSRAFARQLVRWVLALPPGVGLATLRGSLRLLVNFSPERSGVRSAGNGPAMRAALLGVCAVDETHMAALVRASTRVTHTDPRAEDGALLIAGIARALARGLEVDASFAGEVRDPELRSRAQQAFAAAGETLEDYRAMAGYSRGVSGFVVHTVPAAIYCWRRHHDDPEAAIEAAIRLGGDTDTVAAIVGALIGAEHGASDLPPRFVEGIRDWPLGVSQLHALALGLGEGATLPTQAWAESLVRNLAVMLVIAWQLLRRAAGR